MLRVRRENKFLFDYPVESILSIIFVYRVTSLLLPWLF